MTHNTVPLPPIDPQWLSMQVLNAYPLHEETQKGRQLISTLVTEYLRLWRLIRTFPTQQIVGTGPIIAVQRIHWEFRKEYFADCLAYFNRYLFKEMVWKGRTDVEGAVQTVRAYHEVYQQQPPEAWQDIVREYELGRSYLHLV